MADMTSGWQELAEAYAQVESAEKKALNSLQKLVCCVDPRLRSRHSLVRQCVLHSSLRDAVAEVQRQSDQKTVQLGYSVHDGLCEFTAIMLSTTDRVVTHQWAFVAKSC